MKFFFYLNQWNEKLQHLGGKDDSGRIALLLPTLSIQRIAGVISPESIWIHRKQELFQGECYFKLCVRALSTCCLELLLLERSGQSARPLPLCSATTFVLRPHPLPARILMLAHCGRMWDSSTGQLWLQGSPSPWLKLSQNCIRSEVFLLPFLFPGVPPLLWSESPLCLVLQLSQTFSPMKSLANLILSRHRLPRELTHSEDGVTGILMCVVSSCFIQSQFWP